MMIDPVQLCDACSQSSSHIIDQQVGVVNFSPYYQTTEPGKLVTTRISTSNIVSVLCPEDILSSEVQNSNQVHVLSVQSLYFD